MYYEYWGLKRQAFDNVPDPSMYFRAHESVETAVAEVLFAIEEGDECLAVIVGEVGLGKTTSLRVILDSLDPAKYRIAFVTNPDLTFTMLMRDIVGQLKGETCAITRKDDLLEEFNRLLFSTADEGKRVLIFIDEGNAFKPASLESMRLLTNMQMDDRNLFTIVLAGQPKLAKMLEAPSRANLFQRIGVYCRLEKMQSWEVIRDYVDHRLERAGASKRIFTDDAIKTVFEYSDHGIPRLVNKICKLAMKAGETNSLAVIDAELVAAIGERFKRFTAKTTGKPKSSSKTAPDKSPSGEPPSDELAMPIEPGEFEMPVESGEVDEPIVIDVPPKAAQLPVAESEIVTAAAVDAPVAAEETFGETAPLTDQIVAPRTDEAPQPAYAVAPRESAPAADDDHEFSAPLRKRRGGNGNGGEHLSLNLTQVCLDEVLRPEILEKARSIATNERIKMAGQLAAEEIKKHPEVAHDGDPVIMWKELRNEILSAFSAEVNS